MRPVITGCEGDTSAADAQSSQQISANLLWSYSDKILWQMDIITDRQTDRLNIVILGSQNGQKSNENNDYTCLLFIFSNDILLTPQYSTYIKYFRCKQLC